MNEPAREPEAPEDLGVPRHEDDPTRPRELAVVLRGLRRSLLEHDEIAVAVRKLRREVGTRDLVGALLCVGVGIVGQAYAVSNAPLLVPLCLFFTVIGYSGLFSLAHESWHGRSHPNRHVDRWLSRWVYSGFWITDNDVHRKDHRLHHLYPGEPQDPNSVTWKIPPDEFKRHLLARLTILPSIYIALKTLLTGQRSDQNYGDDRHRASPRVWLAIALVHVPWSLGLLWVSPWAFVFGYLLPLSTAAAMARLREYREHALLADGTTAVFDLRCSEFQRLLIPGGFFNYHALHHLFPEVPQRGLPRLYRIIEETVDMSEAYYGVSAQVALKTSYLADGPPGPEPVPSR